MSTVLANVVAPQAPAGDLSRSEFDRWVRTSLLQLLSAVIPPRPVTNMRATALAGAIQIDFTRSDGDGYTLYSNSVPSLNGSIRIDIGTANKYVDSIGAGSVKRFYLIVTKAGNRVSDPSIWVSATSLALGTAITPPMPPPPADIAFTDKERDAIAVQRPDNGSYVPL